MLDPARKYRLTLRLADIDLEKSAAIGTLGALGLGLGGLAGMGGAGYGLYKGVPWALRGAGRMGAAGLAGMGRLLQGSGAKAFTKFRQETEPLLRQRERTGLRSIGVHGRPTTARTSGLDIGEAFRPVFGSGAKERRAAEALTYGGSGLRGGRAGRLRQIVRSQRAKPVEHRLGEGVRWEPGPEGLSAPGLTAPPSLPRDVPGLWRMREGKRMRRWGARLNRLSRPGKTRQIERLRAQRNISQADWAALEAQRNAMAASRRSAAGDLRGGRRRRGDTRQDIPIYNPAADPMPRRMAPQPSAGNRQATDTVPDIPQVGFPGTASPVASMDQAQNAFRQLRPADQTAAMAEHGDIFAWFKALQKSLTQT